MGTDIRVAGDRLPIIRYVYLVEDASNAARMLGNSSNVYLTTQSAYAAADALQSLLGGSTKVVILVGNTTAATVGGLALTANYNSNVEWIGISATDSIIGTVSSGTFSLNIKFTDMTVGTVSSSSGAVTLTAFNCVFGSTITTAGGAVTMTMRACTAGAITTTTAGATASGNVSITSCSNSAFGAITQGATAANVGTLTITTCNDITLGAVTRNQASTTTSFSVGLVNVSSSEGIRFSTFTSTMAFATSTGAIAGLTIGNTNRDVSFSGAVSILGHNVANVASDVSVSAITLYGVTFLNTFHVNSSGASGVYTTAIRGGKIGSLTLDYCVFHNVTSFGYHTIAIAGGTIDINACDFVGTATYGLRILWNKTTLTRFIINRITALNASLSGFSMGAENTGTSSAFSQQLVLRWSNIKDMVIGLLATTAGTEATPNYLLQNCNLPGTNNAIALYKVNEVVKLADCTIEDGINLENSSGASASNSLIYGGGKVRLIDAGAGLVAITTRNAFVTGQLQNLSSYTFLSYGSTLDFFLNGTGTTYTITGTLWTSTLVKHVAATDSTTLNNSITQSL